MKLMSIWQVEGVLETVTPMHVGDGGTVPRSFTRGSTEIRESSEVQTSAKTLDGRARIPGSSLKGVLKSGFPGNDARYQELFGREEQAEDGTPRFTGGLAQFLDAYSESAPDWDGETLGRTAIDGVSGAAKDHLLFFMQMVPPGTRFQVRIRGKVFEKAQSWQTATALIDEGLQRFDTGAIRLGAGESGQHGRCKWTLGAVRVMEAADVEEWLKHPEPLDIALKECKDRRSEVTRRAPGPPTGEMRTISLTLKFDGHPFLVNDARKTGKKPRHAHAARRQKDNRLLLPAESFRGVLAHQAGRIARTKGKSGDRQTKSKKNETRGALRRLFGAQDWGSPMTISDFSEAGGPGPINSTVQEFLAVDRFTGGGSEERKFDAEGGWEPKLRGKITVDLHRLRSAGPVAPALGLFALTLRDLAEGDLAFGWGSGKGYGWATVDTGNRDAVAWVEHALAGWSEGSVAEWIGAWETEEEAR